MVCRFVSQVITVYALSGTNKRVLYQITLLEPPPENASPRDRHPHTVLSRVLRSYRAPAAPSAPVLHHVISQVWYHGYTQRTQPWPQDFFNTTCPWPQ